MKMILRMAARTHIGHVRQRNEDSCGADEASGIAFVADGMGGHPAGDVASRLAAEVLTGLHGGLDASVVDHIRQKLRAYVADHPEDAALGTTLDAVQLANDGSLHIVHIGDSRVYRFANGQLTPLTNDHSYVGDLVRTGLLTREAARVHPLSNLITRYIGAETSFEADSIALQVTVGDRILLATDGLTDLVPEMEIETMAGAIADRDELAAELIRSALRAGGRDNVSVVVADVSDATPDRTILP